METFLIIAWFPAYYSHKTCTNGFFPYPKLWTHIFGEGLLQENVGNLMALITGKPWIEQNTSCRGNAFVFSSIKKGMDVNSKGSLTRYSLSKPHHLVVLENSPLSRLEHTCQNSIFFSEKIAKTILEMAPSLSVKVLAQKVSRPMHKPSF